MNKPNDGFLTFINQLVKAFCVCMMAVMTGIVLLQVVTRLMPGVRAPSWTEELSRYIMIYVAFIGASNGVYQWNNVGVDLVINRMPKKGKYFLNLVIRVTVLIFWIVVLYLGLHYFPRVGGRQFSASMGFPLLYAQISLIVGACLCVLQSLGQIISYAKGGVKNA